MATSRVSSARTAVDLTFEELYRGLRADVYRAALRKLGNAQDAEDVTQAAFVDAYRAVLRGARPQSPRAWLLAISENVRRRRFRTAQRRPREEPLDDADFPLVAELPYEQSRVLTEALAMLSPEQRRVFVLREIVGLSYGEIAEEVGSTVAAVQMLLFRARRSLRDVLDPPTVANRRPVFLPPLPGWVAGLWSRIEIAALTPRTAGALSAAVLTVGGASVAVPVPQADELRRAPAAAEPSAARVAKPAAGRVVVGPAARPVEQTAAARTTVRVKPKPRPARSGPAAALPPTVVPVAPPDAGPVPAAEEQQAVPEEQQAVPAPPPGVEITLVEAVVTRAVDVAAPPVSTPVPLPVPPPLPLPVPVSVTPPALPPPVETVTGAAGAAGASVPPVPVPAVPLPTLPPEP
jgi:RNA polymerase sigma factor (sigma-70 family)